jgi:hypothetical protein
MAAKKEGAHPAGKKRIPDDVRSALIRKYQAVLIDKLTPQDLQELQGYLKNQFDEHRNLNREYKTMFESKLRQYVHEEVLAREIASIEALLSQLKPEDLKRRQ